MDYTLELVVVPVTDVDRAKIFYMIAIGKRHGGPWNSFAFFSDPDGKGWTIQEKPAP